MATSIKVAIRVRPFNKREKELGCTLIVDMQGNSTILANPEDPTDKKTFAFDYSYWSHDGYIFDDSTKTDIPAPGNTKFKGQNEVYSDMGVEILTNAFKGYNSCIFAYGQTGSGKSYSIVGCQGSNLGILPRVCEAIFGVNKDVSPDTKIELSVKVGMIEIYNEKVFDLYVDPSKRTADGLKIRENPKTGVFLEGLK